MTSSPPVSRPIHRLLHAVLRRVAPLLLYVGALAAGAAPSTTERTLTVSAAIDNYPYSFRDENGRLTGYGVDMLNAVAEVMHVRLERVEVTAIKDIDNLTHRRCDIGQFHANQGGSPHALYSQPILVNTGDVFVRTNDRRFTSLDDLRRTRARIAGHVQAHDYLLARGFDPAQLQLATSGEAMHALASGQVDAVLTSRLTGLTQAHHLGLRNVTPLGLDLRDMRVTFCIATRPDDRELLEQINEALATLSTTGRTVEIYTRWFGRYEARGVTRGEILAVAATVLALALLAALWLLHRQRLLRQRIARQAEELGRSREILAEAQRFAHLGHSRRSFVPSEPPVWSEESYHIFERDPAAGVPSSDELIALAIPADRARWRAAMEVVRHGGPPYDFDITIEPVPGRRKIVNVRGRPTFDAIGRQDGTFGTVQDVTASRTAAAALQQSELLLRALYENLPLALGVVERQVDGWRILSLNPEARRQLGIATAPAAGTPLAALGLTAERCEFWRERFDRSTVLGETLRFEFEPAGARQHFSAAIVPLVLPGLSPRCCLLSEETTTRRLKDAELAQSRRLRAIGELVGGIAHEFNNLLTPVALNTEVLLGQCADRPDLREELVIIADAARRAGELTRRLLTFGRRTDHRPENVDLEAIISANIALVRHTFDRRIVLTSSLPSPLPALLLPTGDLHQIVLNLLLNARDALAGKLAHPPTPDWTPRIEISAAALPAAALAPADPARTPAPAGWVRLSVRDNGCGMPLAVRERLFEPFFTTKGVGSGTGLGLATIWHLVTDFGGRIDVDSVPDEGTAFHLSLPLATAPQPAVPPAPATPAPAAPAPPRHFLLADDETSVARVVTRVLERKGHRITATPDGLKAWEALAAAPAAFDAVIMDLNMPGLTGIELARRAHALPYTGPLIVMSGRIGDDEQAELRECGVAAFIAKPFSIAAFEQAIADAFAHRSAK